MPSSSTKIYGIKNCNTVAKALKWLDDHTIPYEFHDYKRSGITETKLKEWTSEVSWETLVNKRGTTWKKLSPELQGSINTVDEAVALMQGNTSVIKRPVIETGKGILVGFDEQAYKDLLS